MSEEYISRAFKCRLYPNKEQTEQIEATFRACRWMWNVALDVKKQAYDATKRSLNTTELCKLVTMYKRSGVAEWIGVAPTSALQQKIRDLDAAYKNFFRRVKHGEKPYGFPQFKKRGGWQSYRTPAAGRLDKASGKYVGQCVQVIDNRHVKLPKLGIVKCRFTQMPEGHVLSATVSRSPSGKYFVSICCADVPYPKMQDGFVDVIGVRVGVAKMMTCSDGTTVEATMAMRKSAKKLRRESRKLSRRKKGSQNWKKQKVKLAKVHERIANQRRDAIHKATTRVVRDSIVVAASSPESKELMQDKRMAKALADSAMFEVRRQLEYKCEWYGRDFVKVDSTKAFTRTCRKCGEQVDNVGKKKSWTCPKCGTVHDTALNAARNIADIGSMELARR